ncbi:MAG TPA: transposase [Candidatus Nanoarchaeia archaeon]|nr:transposase [Candidatus Nanoarchaeia archaeon]
MTTRRRFDREFKLQIIREAEQKPMAELCREHNLNSTVVCRWKKELEQYPKDAFKGRGNLYKIEARLCSASNRPVV